MTPLECAQDVAAFFREQLAAYEERNETIAGAVEAYNVYAGFLPYVSTRQEKEKLCPDIVVRPLEITDGETESLILLGVYVTTYDMDMQIGCYALYHLLEFLRFQLLTHSPIGDRWYIKPGTLETSIPDEQPYPQWWGRLDFSVFTKQPKRVNSRMFT